MALKTFEITIADVDWSAIGDKIYSDAAISDATTLALDFSNTDCWPAQGNAATGAVLYDMSDSGQNASVTGSVTLTYAGGGLAFTVGSTNETVTLPDTAKVATLTGGFAVAFCFRVNTQTQSVKSKIAGYFDGSDNTGPWGVYTQGGYFYFVVNGQLVLGASTTTLGGNDAIVSTVLALVNIGTASVPNWRARLYLNGALAQDVAATTPTVITPTDTTTPTIGESSDGETSAYWIGRAYRLLIHDLASADLDGVVAAEWAQVQSIGFI